MKKLRFPQPKVDIQNFRLSKINQKEYRHFWCLLIWPIYYLRYFIIEAINADPALCHVMYSPLDDLIPVCEFFLIPYGLWMVCLLGMHIFTMLYDPEGCKRYTTFLVVSITISTTVYLVYPTCQNLRPESFERNNLFTWILGILYQCDTSTNVCPSEHVIGSMAVLAAAFHCSYLKKPGRLAAVTVLMILTSLSTVFLKQHSILDVFAAMPVCLVAYLIAYPVMGKNRASSREPRLGTA